MNMQQWRFLPGVSSISTDAMAKPIDWAVINVVWSFFKVTCFFVYFCKHMGVLNRHVMYAVNCPADKEVMLQH